MELVKLLVSFLRLAGQRARRMPRWAPEWGASLSRREDLRPSSRATTRIESGLGASFGAHSRQPGVTAGDRSREKKRREDSAANQIQKGRNRRKRVEKRREKTSHR
jgi:hypothetical protein